MNEEYEKAKKEIEKLSKKDDFDKLCEKLIKEGRKYFVVCMNQATGELFFIEFEDKKKMERFIDKNHGDVYDDIGFYARAFANGEFYDENT